MERCVRERTRPEMLDTWAFWLAAVLHVSLCVLRKLAAFPGLPCNAASLPLLSALPPLSGSLYTHGDKRLPGSSRLAFSQLRIP